MQRLIPWPIVIWVLFPGCTQYPEVTRPENLDLLNQLCTACAARDPEQLAEVQTVVDQRQREDKLGEQEAIFFQAILANARAGNWKAAAQSCQTFQKAQNR